jgi:hypothetical protein
MEGRPFSFSFIRVIRAIRGKNPGTFLLPFISANFLQ